jgi:hypothetical protein
MYNNLNKLEAINITSELKMKMFISGFYLIIIKDYK